jgi:hypothetical protein
MDLTLSKVVEAARQRRAAVTAEVGGYIVLLLLQLQGSGPRRVAPELVGLTAAGEVELAPSPAAERREVEAGLRGLLASLLALSQSAPPALRATSERAATGDLAAFEAELTAALIPINHAASRRALARVFRETQKAQRAFSGAEQERESAAPASLTTPQPSTPVPGPARAAPKMPVPEARVSAPEPPASVAEPAPPEIEIDVDVDVAVPEPEPRVVAAAPALPEPDHVELVVADIELDELDQLLASEPPPASARAIAPAPLEAPEAEALEPAPVSLAAVSLAAVSLAPVSRAPVSLVHPLTPAARALTPLPASVVLESSASNEAQAVQESPAPVCSVALEAAQAPARSDLGELLAGYLSYTRREEDMTAGLRRMIGLEPWRASGLAPNAPDWGNRPQQPG